MCDEQTERELKQFQNRALSRREFGKYTAVAGMAAMFPAVANVLELTESAVEVSTSDGISDCYFVHPATGKHPGVLIWPDILGLRPVFKDMGKRLAQSGYAVLVVNPFYRSSKAPVVPEGASFGDPATRKRVLSMHGELTPQAQFTDAKAYIGFLDQQSAVDTNRKIGTAGYCMGGPLIMRTAAAAAQRVGAAASFHGGGLATDAPDSPHRLIPATTARVLHAIAVNDDQRSPDVKTVLRQAYAEAGIQAEIEVYADTLHGWCVPGSPAYHEAQAERAWERLLALLNASL